MNGRIFIDTNILVFAYDRQGGRKSEKARTVIKYCWENKKGVISTQVLQEFYMILTRKLQPNLSIKEARDIVSRYFSWQVVINDSDTIAKAMTIENNHKLSFWDALIVAAAIESRTDKLITEDLNHGQKIENLVIDNPFLS